MQNTASGSLKRCFAKLKLLNRKHYNILLLGLSLYVLLVHLILIPMYHRLNKIVYLELPNIVVHFDLKGMPPKLAYLESILPLLKNHGANGLLMEYEDMFPYEGRIANLSSKRAYSRTALKQFLTTASSHGFEIIPLIQTFGHLEMALKLPEYKNLREDPAYVDSICPSKRGTKELIKEMLKQIITFHEDITKLKHIHIGCDEIYAFNKCSDCKTRRLNDTQLYADHIKTTEKIVQSFSNTATVLIWDDMMRKIHPRFLHEVKPSDTIEPVYWNYEINVQLPHKNLYTYFKNFKDVWLATAFKGAEGHMTIIPNIENRYNNHFTVLKNIIDYRLGGFGLTRFKGIILTGWSKYSHMDPVCELLPVSIPSLITNLILINQFKNGVPKGFGNVGEDSADMFRRQVSKDLRNTLNCRYRLSNLRSFNSTECEYDGHMLYNLLNVFDDTINSYKESEKYMFDVVRFYHKNSIVSRHYAITKQDEINKTLSELIRLKRLIVFEMKSFYDEDVVREYTEEQLKQSIDDVSTFLESLKKLSNITI